MSFEKDVKTEIKVNGNTLTLHAEMELKAPIWDEKRLRYMSNPDLKRYYSSEAQRWLANTGQDISGLQEGPRYIINNSDHGRKVTWVFSLVEKVTSKKASKPVKDSTEPSKPAPKKRAPRRKAAVKTKKQEG